MKPTSRNNGHLRSDDGHERENIPGSGLGSGTCCAVGHCLAVIQFLPITASRYATGVLLTSVHRGQLCISVIFKIISFLMS